MLYAATAPEAKDPSLVDLGDKALSSDPFVLFLVLLIIVACIIGVVVWRRYVPKKTDTGETLRSGNKEFIQLVKDLAVHRSTWDEDLFERLEARGKKLHELVNELQALKTAHTIKEREYEDMKAQLRKLEGEHNAVALSVARIEVDSRHTREAVQEIKEKLERIEAPLIAIQTWVERRKQLGGPVTP